MNNVSTNSTANFKSLIILSNLKKQQMTMASVSIVLIN